MQRAQVLRQSLRVAPAIVHSVVGQPPAGSTVSQTITVTVGSATYELTINVAPLSGLPPLNITINGQLTIPAPSGGSPTPVPNQTIWLYENDQAVDSTQTDQNGNYTFNEILSFVGTYAIFAAFYGLQ